MGASGSIMIVDDNTSLCRTISYIFRRKGYDVAIANNGSEAIKSAREKKHFDVVSMDIKMPLMDGVETYKRIERIIPETAVVMMTAYAVEDLIQEALEKGAYGVIYKPLDIDRAIALIEETTELREGALIMVVDDDSATCATFKNILQKRGHEVGTAQTGEEAIAMARQKCYGIYFIDIKLPTINGLETHLAIREIRPEVITIVITAYGQEMSDLVDAALQESVYSCLYKPLDIPSVLRLIEEVLRRKRKT